MTRREFLTETEAAKYIGMSVPFLRNGRCKGVVGNRTPAPPHLKLGSHVRYERTDLDTWLDARRVDPLKRKSVAVAAISA